MTLYRLCKVLCFGVTLAILCAGAQGQSAADRVAQVSEINSLDADGTKPWHLLLSYQLFDEQGKPTAQGTIEQWWVAKDKLRRVITQDGVNTVFVINGEESFHSAGVLSMPTPLHLLLQDVVHPVEPEGLSGAVPEVRKHDFGKVKTECLMLTQPVKGVYTVPLGLFPTYCVGDNDLLRLSMLSASIIVVNNQVGKFLGHHVPIQIDVQHGNVKSVSGHVEKLETIDAAAVDLSTEGLVSGKANGARVASGVTAGLLLTKVTPSYPMEAKQNHISGTVVLHAIIGTDGRVQSLHVVSSPDGSLSLAALIAVEQWTYKPYILINRTF